jgi:membrane fusion protein (multidrug efflux system)
MTTNHVRPESRTGSRFFMKNIARKRLITLLGVFAAGLLLLGCGRQTPAKEMQQAPPPEVGVVVVQPQRVPITTDLSGRIAPCEIAEVRPQVGGIIQSRLFVEGSDVKKGQVLYRIDDATYKAACHSADATLAKAEANVLPARLKADRLRDLVKINAVSQQDYDDAAAAFKLAKAEVEAARAALETARINLDYTAVKAPISGRIGRSEVTTGALVTAGQATALTTIQKLDPIYVDVTQSTADLLRLKRELAGGALQKDADSRTPVTLMLEDGSRYPLEGTLKFSDVTVNQGTGSVTLRTLFPNPDQLLLPGMFARATVEEGVLDQAILIPQQGVSRDPVGNATAMVVGAGDKVESRTLKIARAIDNQWVVSVGLQPGDRVIVEGLQKAAPGTTVRVVEIGGRSAETADQKIARE